MLAQGAPVLDEQGEVTRFVGILTDVTELVELSDAQRRSDERFRKLIAKAPLGQTVVDPRRARIIEVNRAYAALVGRTPEELAGHQRPGAGAPRRPRRGGRPGRASC